MGMSKVTNQCVVARGTGLAVAFSALICAGACQPKAASEAVVATPAAKTAAAADPVPVAPAVTPTLPKQNLATKAIVQESSRGDSAAGSANAITGGWVNAGGACDSGAAVMFNSDGTYLAEGEKGTWALSGKTLTVTTSSFDDPDAGTTQGPEQSPGDVGEKSILTVLSITDDAARVVLANGTNASWTRCNG
jgi:hypothetical protein